MSAVSSCWIVEGVWEDQVSTVIVEVVDEVCLETQG